MKASVISTLFLIFTFIGTSIVAQDEVSDLNIYTTVDKMPRLKGAGKDVGEYVRKKISYDDAYKLQGIEGDVWVSFVVTAQGEVTQVEVEKGVDAALDAEVIKAVQGTRKWKPGEVNRKPVNTQMRVPVQFTLSNTERRLAQQIKSLDEQGKRPLFVLDNKLIDGLVQINDYNVESIRILKGDKAIKLYGDRAENGVVVITSKNGTPPLY
ncbi:TonB family protein [Carboxylicivirga sp. A043]|uniref:energy transducer TonB n=1 Tax=Carboxylicivirga litoralis TaxID=2816963 RepID=UPI0021CB71DD|nr:energy transducer TonB [Carboxylicivirga sp. A043]MCU4157671.1 TonB family protein [Carboxylicivirga sp. A043]